MSKYALVAIKTVEFYKNNSDISIKKSWEITVDEVFGNTSSAKKNCPKSTFLGLCEAGYVEGVESGNYTRSEKNKKYGIDAIEILQNNYKIDSENIDAKVLWKKVCNDIPHNSQMDVVLGLWNNNLIKKKK